MRNLLALLGLAIVIFAIVGYYQNWYSFTKTPDGAIKVNVDVNEIKKDLTNAGQQVEGAVKK